MLDIHTDTESIEYYFLPSGLGYIGQRPASFHAAPPPCSCAQHHRLRGKPGPAGAGCGWDGKRAGNLALPSGPAGPAGAVFRSALMSVCGWASGGPLYAGLAALGDRDAADDVVRHGCAQPAIPRSASRRTPSCSEHRAAQLRTCDAWRGGWQISCDRTCYSSKKRLTLSEDCGSPFQTVDSCETGLAKCHEPHST